MKKVIKLLHACLSASCVSYFSPVEYTYSVEPPRYYMQTLSVGSSLANCAQATNSMSCEVPGLMHIGWDTTTISINLINVQKAQ